MAEYPISLKAGWDDSEARAAMRRLVAEAQSAAQQIQSAFRGVGGGAGGGFTGTAGGGGAIGDAGAGAFQGGGPVAPPPPSSPDSSYTGQPTPGGSPIRMRLMGAAYLAARGIQQIGRYYNQVQRINDEFTYGSPIAAVRMTEQDIQGRMGGFGEAARAGWVGFQRLLGDRTQQTDQEQLDETRRTIAGYEMGERQRRLVDDQRNVSRQRQVLGRDPFTQARLEAGFRFEDEQRTAGEARAFAGKTEGLFGFEMGSGLLRRAADSYEREASQYLQEQTDLIARKRGGEVSDLVLQASALFSRNPVTARRLALRGRFVKEAADTEGEDPGLRAARGFRMMAALGAIDDDDKEARDDAARSDYQRVARERGLINSLRATLSRNPLGARIARLTGNMAADLSGTSILDVGEIGRIGEKYGLAGNVETQAENDRRSLTQMHLSNAITAQQYRNQTRPYSAQAQEIFGEGMGVITGLQQHGDYANARLAQQYTAERLRGFELDVIRRGGAANVNPFAADFSGTDARTSKESMKEAFKTTEQLLQKLVDNSNNNGAARAGP